MSLFPKVNPNYSTVMRYYHYLLIGLLFATAGSCTVADIAAPDNNNGLPSSDEVFYATIDDQPGGADTKTFTNNTLHVFWNADDRVTVFNNVTGGLEYTFQGDDNDTGGSFKKTHEDEFAGGESLGGMKYAIYPHRENTRITHDGVISYTLPSVQTYHPCSFGRGDNPMVARTEDDAFRFKNIGGYLVFKFYGENVSVTSVTLKGNNHEYLAGKCSVDMSSGLPEVTIDPDYSTDEITLDCPVAVKLNDSSEKYTEFWFVLPPVEFKKETGGFTITINTPDGVFVKPAPIDLKIERNKLKRIAPIEVNPTPLPEDETIQIRGISSVKNHKTDYDKNTHAFTITLPTVTDFSNLVLDYDLEEGDMLMADGVRIENGVTPIDASHRVCLVVRRGDSIMKYYLEARNTGLPVVKIDTKGKFTLEELESYQNALQSSDGSDHREWLPGSGKITVRIENPDGSEGMKIGGKSEYEVKTKIKGRGNYTWKWPKKPYALKLDEETEVLGMPAHKRWILLANWRDRTLLRNDAAFWLSRAAEMPYTVRGQFVELEFNGEHRGNYYLCEQIKIDQNRVNITSIDYGDLGLQNTDEHTGGYLMEIDSYFDEVNKFHSAEFGLNYMFKEPDEEELTKTDSLYMSKYINDLEKIIKTKSAVVTRHEYEDYLDVPSVIKFMLLNELTGNRDFFQGYPHYGPHSTYLYKDAGGKLFMGPVWDFDYETFIPAKHYSGGYNPTYNWRGFDNSGYYYYWLCADQQFVDQVKTLWAELKSNSGEAFLTYINDMVDSLSLSQEFDEIMWPHDSGQENWNDNHDYDSSVRTYQDAIDLMKSSFTSKLNWMDGQIQNLKTTTFSKNRNWKYQ